MPRSSYQQPKVKQRMSARGVEWFIRYRVWVVVTVDGRPVKVKKEKHHALGLKSEMTAAQAKREAAEIIKRVNERVDTAASHIPFAEFVEVYKQEHYRGLKAPTQVYYSQRIKDWILPFFGSKKMCEIGAFDVTRLLGDMERADVARNTRKVTRSIIHNIFKCARKWGYIEKGSENPADDAEVGRSRGNAVVKWTPTMEEATAIIEGVGGQAALLLWCIIWTGMRISEACGLRCRNVDLVQREVHVKERIVNGEMDDPKSEMGNRKLPLGDFAAQLAPLMGKPEEFLFRRDGKGISQWTYGPLIREAMVAVGVRHKGNLYHAFRRLHADLMKKSLNRFDLKAQMGHASITTTELYLSDDLTARRDALSEAQSKIVSIRRQA